MPEIEARGARLIAVSPENADSLETLKQERKLTLPILVDAGNEVARRFGIRHVLPPALREVYRSFGLDLEAANGDSSWSLPMPARYVLDASGIIRWAAADPDYTVRPEPEESLQALDDLR